MFPIKLKDTQSKVKQALEKKNRHSRAEWLML